MVSSKLVARGAHSVKRSVIGQGLVKWQRRDGEHLKSEVMVRSELVHRRKRPAKIPVIGLVTAKWQRHEA